MRQTHCCSPKTVLLGDLVDRALEVRADAFYFNWDIESHRKAITGNPEDFWQVSDTLARKGKQRIGLDEIHKYPRWKRFLKGLYDARDNDLDAIVTGSGRLDIYQPGGDSLFGRYHLYRLHPFTLREYICESRKTVCPPGDFWQKVTAGRSPAGAKEGLEDLDALTGFPEPLFSASEARLKRWRRSHQTLLVREDLRDLTRIREIGLVETLVAFLPERIGSSLSVNSLREDLGINFMTAQGWLEA